MEYLVVHGKRFLNNLLTKMENPSVDMQEIDNIKFRIDWFSGVLERYRRSRLLPNAVTTGIDSILQKLSSVQDLITQVDQDIFKGYTPKRVFTGNRGRPIVFVPKEQLELLLEYHFSIPKIAGILGVSVSTVNRRLKEFDLSVGQTYSSISDSDLDKLTQQLIEEFPNCGYPRMTGLLRYRRVRVQQRRVRESMRRSDPEASRWTP